MFIPRLLNLEVLLQKSSFFLFGPRLSGKSRLIAHQLSDAFIINLLKTSVYLELSTHPARFEQLVKSQDKKLIVIDEVQRLPWILNDVHSLIEEDGYRFLLTGSSGKKLKKAGTNLLAGRARVAQLHPLTFHELGDRFNIEHYLNYGGLPQIYLSDDPQEQLYTYVDLYLREEIQAEAFVRKLNSFLKFLEIAALTNGQILNFSKIASDIGLPVSSVREYYFLLEDTFIGFLIPPFTDTIQRKCLTSSKFYLFDLGVCRTLAGLKLLDPKTENFGFAFEHFIALELRACLSYTRSYQKLFYFRSTQGDEVDFIIGNVCAIEVKAADHVKDKHLTGLQLFQKEMKVHSYFLVSFDLIDKKIGDIYCLHWTSFLKKLYSDDFIALLR
ncbi:MAG: ATP-binding protein [Gammaproteobacteria bacterium]|nr:ATP-binding protein [Gammaproteobacteria bacterium]